MGEKASKEKVKTSSLKFARHFSSGGVVFKKKGKKVLWLVAQTTSSQKFPQTYWRLPKGWIDDSNKLGIPGPMATGVKRAKEEDIRKAALREVKEEGGIKAKIVAKIGTISFFYVEDSTRISKYVTFYLMEWEKDLPQGFSSETSEIKWLEFEKAFQKLSFKTEKETLSKAKDILETGIQASLI